MVLTSEGHAYKRDRYSQNIHLSLSLSQKNYVTQEVQFYNRQIDFGHL
jgi:hypothetical protein